MARAFETLRGNALGHPAAQMWTPHPKRHKADAVVGASRNDVWQIRKGRSWHNVELDGDDLRLSCRKEFRNDSLSLNDLCFERIDLPSVVARAETVLQLRPQECERCQRELCDDQTDDGEYRPIEESPPCHVVSVLRHVDLAVGYLRIALMCNGGRTHDLVPFAACMEIANSVSDRTFTVHLPFEGKVKGMERSVANVRPSVLMLS